MLLRVLKHLYFGEAVFISYACGGCPSDQSEDSLRVINCFMALYTIPYNQGYQLSKTRD